MMADPAKVAHVPVGWKPISCEEWGPSAMASRHAISYPITTDVINSRPSAPVSSPAASAQLTTEDPAWITPFAWWLS